VKIAENTFQNSSSAYLPVTRETFLPARTALQTPASVKHRANGDPPMNGKPTPL